MHAVSVFLVTYDGMRFVTEAARSLLAQTHADFELVALDDGSCDGTAEALGSLRDSRLSVRRWERNRGAAHNWNRALELVETPYFAICHQDDIYHPEFLARMLALLAARPRAFIAHCKAHTIDEHGSASRSPNDRYKDTFWPAAQPYERVGRAELEALRRGSYIVTPGVLYRSAAVREIGFFSAALRQSIDWDYWLRGVLAGYSVAGTHERLVSYRRHPGMSTCRSEDDFTRYREEVEVLRWVAGAAFRAGMADDARPDYSIVVNTLLSKLARRLASSQLDGARRLLRFAEEEIPGFAGSARHRLAQSACALGRRGGQGLQAAELTWHALLSAWSKLPSPRLGSARLVDAGMVSARDGVAGTPDLGAGT